MKVSITIEATAEDNGESDDVKTAVQTFIDDLYDNYNGEDIVAKLTVLEDAEIEITPSGC